MTTTVRSKKEQLRIGRVSCKSTKTNAKLAKQYGVSERTIRTYKKIYRDSVANKPISLAKVKPEMVAAVRVQEPVKVNVAPIVKNVEPVVIEPITINVIEEEPVEVVIMKTEPIEKKKVSRSYRTPPVVEGKEPPKEMNFSDDQIKSVETLTGLTFDAFLSQSKPEMIDLYNKKASEIKGKEISIKHFRNKPIAVEKFLALV